MDSLQKESGELYIEGSKYTQHNQTHNIACMNLAFHRTEQYIWQSLPSTGSKYHPKTQNVKTKPHYHWKTNNIPFFQIPPYLPPDSFLSTGQMKTGAYSLFG